MDSKRGQVWVETVIYTLIGLTIIGLVLAGALPKINQKKDQIMIEQSIEALGSIDDKIYEVQRATGSNRIISLDIKTGAFIIDPENDTLYWKLESSYPFSDIDFPVAIGRMTALTTGTEAPYTILLSTGYGFDIRYEDSNTGLKQLDAAPVPYDISIENKGKESGNIIINFNEN